MISNKLKFYRKANKITQEQIAETLGIKRSTYAYYETGKNRPGVEILLQIAKLYNISIDTLVNDSPAEQQIYSANRAVLADNTNLYNREDEASEDTVEEAEEKYCEEQYLSSLTKDERNIILLYRLAKDKEEIKRFLENLSK